MSQLQVLALCFFVGLLLVAVGVRLLQDKENVVGTKPRDLNHHAPYRFWLVVSAIHDEISCTSVLARGPAEALAKCGVDESLILTVQRM